MVRARLLTLCSALAAIAGALSLAAGASLAAPSAASVVALPAAQSVPATGALPSRGSRQIALNTARGEREGAWLVTRGARQVEARVASGSLGQIGVEVAWGHFVRVGPKLVADALLPWDGAPREVEQPNQPLYVRVAVPRSVAPGTYRGAVVVTADGRATTVPLTVRVFRYTLPERGVPTSFHVSPTRSSSLWGR